MGMRCYAIKRTGSNNELMHWKYIKKERKNGKWKYYYDDTKNAPYNNNLSKTEKVTTEYKNTDKLFDSESAFKTANGTTIIKKRGTISQKLDDLGLSRFTGDKTPGYMYDNNVRKTQEVTTAYENGKQWFNNTATVTTLKYKHVTKSRGKFDQLIADAEKFIFDNFLDKRQSRT